MPRLEDVNRDPELAKRWALVKRHGNRSTSYLTLQPGLEAFFGPGEDGYVAYQRFAKGITTLWGLFPERFVLSDPVAAPAGKRELLKRFIGEVGDASFLQVSAQVAAHLNDLGYSINEFGVEIHLDIPSFSLEGHAKRKLRLAWNHGIDQEIDVRELRADHVAATDVEAISREWIAGKKTKHGELRFLTSPLVLGQELDGRRFYAFQEGRLVGYVFFLPIYRDDAVLGYVANVMRARKNTTQGLLQFIILRALHCFRREGKIVLSLGWSPLAAMETVTAFRTSTSLAAFLKFLHNRCNMLYSFQGLYFHKSRYGGREEKVYFASRGRASVFSVLKVFQLCDVF